jgi:hypothetical protein
MGDKIPGYEDSQLQLSPFALIEAVVAIWIDHIIELLAKFNKSVY